jgi:hypothetical protein
MNKGWIAIRHDLSRQTKKHREFLYYDFCQFHARWSKDLKNALYLVVVELQPQSAVAVKFELHKQVINRAIRKYKLYLLA